jgi:co-chaperonin GroES (HSP10)
MHKLHTAKLRSLGRVFGLIMVFSTLAAFSQTPPARVIGTVKSVTGSTIVVTLDSDTDSTITFGDGARIVQASPGQTDLKSATPIQVTDIQVGDRVAARGQAGEANSLAATFALVMKKTDIAQKQQQERDEWRKGVGGLAKEVNAADGTITIGNSTPTAKPIVIHVSPQADIRRYSPDSVKFEDAKPGTLAEVKVGDNVRARGTKSEDGTEFTAQGIVSGSFRNIAATVISADAGANSITITDLTTKKPITVKIAQDSMLRRLPQMMAMGMAMRLKGISMPAGMGGGAPGSGGNGAGNSAAGGWRGSQGQGAGQAGQGAPGAAGAQPGGGSPGGQAPGDSGSFRRGSGGSPDIQQMLSRMPAMPLTDLKKGDAIILVATEGSDGSGPTAITLVAGVEPILTAAPPGMNAAATMLSPWNLGQGGGGGGDASVGQ